MKRAYISLGILCLAVITIATTCPNNGLSPGPTNQDPIASFSCSSTSGNSPLNVLFDASPSYDPDGSIVSYEWDFGDGGTGSHVRTRHTYTTEAGVTFTCTLTVTDNDGAHASASEALDVAPPLPQKECRVTVMLEMIELDYNNHVGNEWSFSVTVDGQETSVSQHSENQTVYDQAMTGTDTLRVAACAIEHDKHSDYGYSEETLTINCPDAGVETEYAKLEVRVQEGHGRYAGNTALWRFYLRVYVRTS